MAATSIGSVGSSTGGRGEGSGGGSPRNPIQSLIWKAAAGVGSTGELVTVVVVDLAWDDAGVIDPGSFCFATSLVTTTGNCVFTVSFDLDDVCARD